MQTFINISRRFTYISKFTDFARNRKNTSVGLDISAIPRVK